MVNPESEKAKHVLFCNTIYTHWFSEDVFDIVSNITSLFIFISTFFFFIFSTELCGLSLSVSILLDFILFSLSSFFCLFPSF